MYYPEACKYKDLADSELITKIRTKLTRARGGLWTLHSDGSTLVFRKKEEL